MTDEYQIDNVTWAEKDENGNIVVDPDVVNTDELHTVPTRSLVELSADQSVANDSLTSVDWDTETNDGQVSGLLDSTNNVVVIPSGFDYAKIDVGINVSVAGLRFIRAPKNGSSYVGQGRLNVEDGSTRFRSATVTTGWVSVTENDEIGTEVIQDSGSSLDIVSNQRTYMEVWLI